MRHGADHVHVVGDEQVAQALFFLQALQQAQHLLLDSHIERAGGLVEHQHLRLHDERARHGQALTLAARKFMRVALQQARVLRLSQAHFGQHGLHARTAFGHAECGLMHLQALAHDLFDREAGGQGRERVLKHHLHPAAKLLVGGRVAHGGLLPRLPPHLQLPRRGQQPQDGLGQRGLARAGFAHHAQRLTGQQLQGGALHRHKLAFFEPAFDARQRRGVDHAQVLRPHHGRSACRWVGLDHIAAWLAGDQTAGVGMLGRGEHLVRGALLHLVAAVHDEHAVGHLCDHAHVMGDEDHAHVHLVLQLADQLQDLRLDGHVQRRGRLVGDQELRLARQRHGDHHALAHATRELVREAVQHILRLGDAHQLQHAQRLGARAGAVHALVHADGFGDLLTGREHRVQRGHGLLEDHGHVGAAHLAHLRLRRPGHVQHLAAAPAQQRRAAHDLAAAMLDQAHQRQRGDRLARARLADDGQGLATIDVEGQLAHGIDNALGAGETHAQVVHGQHTLLGQRQRRGGVGGLVRHGRAAPVSGR